MRRSHPLCCSEIILA
uniref:Uncharacterized protein n=1 Tax=Anguilla anguilla TaxID=7936 RepID=A0A0E9PTB4_ANGAN